MKTREDFFWMPQDEWEELKRSIFDYDYWERMDVLGMACHSIEHAWKEIENELSEDI